MVKETFNAKETFEAGYEMGKKALLFQDLSQSPA